MITLRQILSLVNFRRLEDTTGDYCYNSDTIRIYFGDLKDWFEFGIYDFGPEGDRDDMVERILTKEMLDSEVTSIRRATELDILEIHMNPIKSVDK